MHPTQRYSPFVASAIREIDLGVNAHARWIGDVHRDLICGAPRVVDAAAEDGHRLCQFGAWLHGKHGNEWERWADELGGIEEVHRLLHDGARRLLELRGTGKAIPAKDYEAFIDNSMRFKLAVRALEFGLISEVCMVDHLTGVWNRSSMMQRLSEEFDRMMRTGQTCCIAMMDLDHFKAVNDVHGHVAGDVVLQSVAILANRCLRPYDSMFRYGGEEFLFCLPNTSADTAVTALERVRADIEAASIPLKENGPVRITASFGVTTMNSSVSLEECIEEADRALFCAKAGGRNRVCRWGAAD